MGEKKEGSEKKQDEGQSKGDGGISTIVLKFDMHCEGCAKKIRRTVKTIDGVDNVKTDCSSGKLTVVGKMDPVEVKERVEEKIKKKVELLTLQQNKPATKDGGASGGGDGGGSGGAKKSDGKSDNDNKKKLEDKKENEKPKEPPIATVVLKTRVHCDGCSHKIKKIVGKCEGVQDVNVDLQKDTITIKGTMNMKDLLPYLNTKLKRNVELATPKKDESGGGEKKPKEGGGGGEKPKEGRGGGEKPKEGGGGGNEKPKQGGGGGGGEKPKQGGDGGGESKEGGGGEKKDGGSNSGTENVTKIEVNKMEYNPYYGYGSYAYTYDPRQQGDVYGHQVVEYWHEPQYSQPPQMFSDENPNACSIM